MGRRKSLAERFWSKVEKGGPNECWDWTGAVTGTADEKPEWRYGYLGRTPPSRVGPEVPTMRAHVASWIIHHGSTDGLHVLHRCDRPICVNPNHLFLGTQADNNRDRSARHRDADRRGPKNPNVKLTPEQVAAICEEYAAGGVSQIALAARYGVVQPQISRIVRGVNYNDGQLRSVGSRRRLTSEQVASIREEYAAGATQVSLAAKYGVVQPQISRIVHHVSYAG